MIERELHFSPVLANTFLDLGTGKVLSAPKEFLDALRAKSQLTGGEPQAYAVRDWMQPRHADVLARKDDLVQTGGICFPLGANTSRSAVSASKKSRRQAASNAVPVTILLRTSRQTSCSTRWR